MAAPAPPISYAQAAKGGAASNQNSATSSRVASGAITPAKEGTASQTQAPNGGAAVSLAQNLDALKAKEQTITESADAAKPKRRSSNLSPNGDGSPISPAFVASSISTLAREDDVVSLRNGSSESTWDHVSQSSRAGETIRASSSKLEKSDSKVKSWVEASASKPAAEVEAPIPKVNVWEQRKKLAASTKAPAPASAPAPLVVDGGSSDSTSTGVPDHGLGIQGLKKEQPASSRVQSQRQPARDDDSKSKRSGPKKAGDEKSPAVPPSIRDQTLWPTAGQPTEADRKQASDKTPQSDKEKKKGYKNNWVTLDIPPPSVRFNTPLPNAHGRRGGRGGGRGGRDGNTKGSPPGRNNREERSDGPRDKDGQQSISPKGRKAPNDEFSAKKDSRSNKDQLPREVNGDSLPNGKPTANAHDEGKAPAFVQPKTGARNTRRQDTPAEPEKKEVKSVASSSSSAAASDVAAPRETTPASMDEHPRPGSTTEPLPSTRFPRNGHQGYYNTPGPRRGGVRGGRAGGHGFHTPGHQGAPFQAYNMRSPPINDYYGAHAGRGGYRGSRNGSYGQDWNGRFVNNAYHQTPMLAPLNTYVGPEMMGYDRPPEPMSAIPYQHIQPYNIVGSVTVQLEYYFSKENLKNDEYLRKHMDSEGFVLLSTVGNFKRLRSFTQDIEILKWVCQGSHQLEYKFGVDGKDRVRIRDGWQEFVLPMDQRDTAAQHDGVEGQKHSPVEFQPVPLRQSSMPMYQVHPASAYPAVNGGSHHEMFMNQSMDGSNFGRYQVSPPAVGHQFTPPNHMVQSGQNVLAENFGSTTRSPVQAEQHAPPIVNGNATPATGPNGTSHET